MEQEQHKQEKQVKTMQTTSVEVSKPKPTIVTMVLEKATKIDLIRQFSGLTLNKIVAEQYPTLGSVKRQLGLEKTETISSIILSDLSHSFNGELSNDAIQEVAVELTSSLLRNLSFEDVYLVCKKIKSDSHFGKLNLNKVLKALNSHLDDKTSLISENNYSKHLDCKSDTSIRSSEIEKQKHHDAKLWYLGNEKGSN